MKIKKEIVLCVILGVMVLVFSPYIFAHGSIHEHPAKPHYPPQKGHWVMGHWTPYDPPEPAEGAYIIQKGDTLWDISERFLDDPFLWPQIWEENKYILDSHWIYPGDPLVIPPKPTVIPKVEEKPPVVEEKPEEVAPAPPEEPVTPPGPILKPVADYTDMFCSGYVVKTHTTSGIKIAGREELGKFALSEGDIVYINKGYADGIQGGDEFSLIRANRTIYHPSDGKPFGIEVVRLGRIHVIAVQEKTATARIAFSCSDILVGEEVVPFYDIPIPMVEGSTFERWKTEFSGKPTGFILDTRDALETVGEGHIVYIDLGENAGVRPGDYLRIYRENTDAEELPRIMLGELVVLTVQKDTATGKIVTSVKEMEPGDEVELK